jgi:hypothetical protein
VENSQNKYKRLDIRKYTLPELEIILELGNFDDFTKEVFKRLNNSDTIVKISMDLTDKEKYGYIIDTFNPSDRIMRCAWKIM